MPYIFPDIYTRSVAKNVVQSAFTYQVSLDYFETEDEELGGLMFRILKKYIRGRYNFYENG